MKQGVCILGSTGSIGCSTLDVIGRNLDRFKVEVLTANENSDKLLQQCRQYNPRIAVIADASKAEALQAACDNAGLATRVTGGADAIIEATSAEGVAIVVAAIVGAAGLLPTLAAVEAGHKVLLANKEALVMSGELFIEAVAKSGATLLPVDSEHNAIFQCLPVNESNAQPDLGGVNQILLTGSGGPFRTLPLTELSSVTPEQAVAHPNWEMGKKISVDSATMMNKGLELIEACFLFGIGLENIKVVVHPQSIVHSMVSFKDGSVLAQMGNPDMRTPIAHTLSWPERIEAGVTPLDFYQMANLTFEKPDFERFPCLRLAAEAWQRGGTAPCVLNAANEVAVAAFLDKKIQFTDIAQIIEKTLATSHCANAGNIGEVLAADEHAREVAESIVTHLGER